jgi:16S rRNA (cytosine967-C5)-methyltransferase
MLAPARDAAFRALTAVAEGQADLGTALSRARDPLADPRDRALATELTMGALRWRGAIDYQLQRLSARPLAKLDNGVLEALRLGAYQLLFLERIPVSAVVNDSVNLVKRAGLGSAAGLVNAVLRRLARERGGLAWPDRHDLVEYLSVVHSHPAWLVQRWLARYGEQVTEHWLRFNNLPAAMTLSTNRLLCTRRQLAARLQAEHVETVETAVSPHGLTVISGHPLTSRTFRDGYCFVQDEASQLVPELLQAAPRQRVLDVCASPGGKAMAAAAQCAPDGLVVATDVRRARIELLATTVARCHAANVRVAQISATSALPFRDDAFDRVLIDAPCSGLGTLRRDPDIRWRRRPADFEELARAQRDLLRRVRPVVARRGSVVYSTCSSEPEENELVVAAFLDEAPEFTIVPISARAVRPAIASMQTPEGYLRTSPTHSLEAFFGAILQRT